MKKECWKPCPGFDGFYEVSDLGRVRSVTRSVIHGNHLQTYTGRILRHCINKKTKYHQVSFSKDGVAVKYYVHVLVGIMHVPNPNKYPELNHLKGNKNDNRAKMLGWTTRSGNILHAYATGLNPGSKPMLGCYGYLHNMSRETLVKKNGKKVGVFPSARAAAIFIGVADSSVKRACKGSGICMGFQVSFTNRPNPNFKKTA